MTYSLMLIMINSFPATMTKIIKEMLPPDVRVARDAQDLLIECCVGEIIVEISIFHKTFSSFYKQ